MIELEVDMDLRREKYDTWYSGHVRKCSHVTPRVVLLAQFELLLTNTSLFRLSLIALFQVTEIGFK